jgi:hypothetical protein
LSTAHATNTPHIVGQIAKAQRLFADTIERQATEPRDPEQVATWLTEQLQGYGWTPPRDLAEQVPLRPEQVADEDSPGRRAFRAARDELARRAAPPSTSASQTTNQHATISASADAPADPAREVTA